MASNEKKEKWLDEDELAAIIAVFFLGIIIWAVLGGRGCRRVDTVNDAQSAAVIADEAGLEAQADAATNANGQSSSTANTTADADTTQSNATTADTPSDNTSDPTAADSAAGLESAGADADAQTGISASDDITPPTFNNNVNGATFEAGTITFSGRGEPGTQQAIFVDEQAYGSVPVDEHGLWQISVPLETPGIHTLEARTFDDADRLLASSTPVLVNIIPAVEGENGAAPVDGTSQAGDGDTGEATTAPDGDAADASNTDDDGENSADTDTDSTTDAADTASIDPNALRLYDTAATIPDLTNFARAVQIAGLQEGLNGGGPFTLLAPSNEAFAKLSPETLDTIVNNPEALKALLSNHLLPGTVTLADLAASTSQTNVAGVEMSVTTANNLTTINDAAITAGDISAQNGIVHVIDTILLPPTTPQASQLLQESGQHTIFLAALERSGMAATLNQSTPVTIFAPTDEAFARLPQGSLDAWQNSPEALAQLMENHVVGVDGTFSAEQTAFTTGTPIETDSGTLFLTDRVLLPVVADLAPPIIDDSGVPTFKGTLLTVVGQGTPGTRLLLEINGELHGETTVGEDGRWLVANDITDGDYEIIAWTLAEDGRALAESTPVYLFVQN